MKSAFTILEVLIVCAIVGIVAAVAAPKIGRTLDSIAVESASREVVNAFALGRLAALRHGGAELRVDTASVAVRAGGQIAYERNVRRLHGVRLRATTPLVRYAATGLGTGLSNGTIYLTRGAAAETVLVSRLGRVRR